MDRRRRGESRRHGSSWLLVGLAVLLAGVGVASGQPGAQWREAPEFLRLFAPASPAGLPAEASGAKAGAYHAYVSPLDIDTVLKRLQGDASLLRPPGAWAPRALSPLDAFGQIGGYNRWTVMRLYSGRPPRVARGPRAEDARVVESWTLVSPHPDATLQRLLPGTLLIVLRIP